MQTATQTVVPQMGVVWGKVVYKPYGRKAYSREVIDLVPIPQAAPQKHNVNQTALPIAPVRLPELHTAL
jgi:hypothetical protein